MWGPQLLCQNVRLVQTKQSLGQLGYSGTMGFPAAPASKIDLESRHIGCVTPENLVIVLGGSTVVPTYARPANAPAKADLANQDEGLLSHPGTKP